jgi:hypothetical protein
MSSALGCPKSRRAETFHHSLEQRQPVRPLLGGCRDSFGGMQGPASAILAHDGTYARFVQVTHRSWVAVIDYQHQKPAKPRRELLIDFRSAPDLRAAGRENAPAASVGG